MVWAKRTDKYVVKEEGPTGLNGEERKRDRYSERSER
jgi:hypothetical protein